jgi:hypothetical protein
VFETYDRIPADGRLGVLELLLHAADDRLAVGAHVRAQHQLRVHRVRPDHLGTNL